MSFKYLAFVVLAAAAPANAQAPDTVVEVLGLKKWTYQMVQDSVQHYAPGTTLASYACAVILRDSIGFAQASVEQVSDRDHVYRTLVVVEPQMKKRLRPLELKDSMPFPSAWQGIIADLNANPRSFNLLQDPAFFSGASNNALGRAADSAAVHLRDEIRHAASVTNIEDAVRGFTRDRNRQTRVAAALVLGHKAADPRAWRALLKGLRGPSDNATTTGQMMLGVMSRTNPQQVDWSESKDDIKALLAGTNLFAYLAAVRALTATKIDPALGREVAKSEKDLLLANLNSKSPMRSGTVRAFLRQIDSELSN